jgi:hypothetical protein
MLTSPLFSVAAENNAENACGSTKYSKYQFTEYGMSPLDFTSLGLHIIACCDEALEIPGTHTWGDPYLEAIFGNFPPPGRSRRILTKPSKY